MKTYTIRSGAAFMTRDDKGQEVTLTGGQQVELEDDVAKTHADKLESSPAASAGDGEQTSAPEA